MDRRGLTASRAWQVEAQTRTGSPDEALDVDCEDPTGCAFECRWSFWVLDGLLSTLWTIGGGIVCVVKIHFEHGILSWFQSQTTVLRGKTQGTNWERCD
jgi:hypothetical protein